MISCDQHDYIEIVCTFRYPVKLFMKSGVVLEGIALDTQFNNNKEECVLVEIDGHPQLIVLDDLSQLDVLVDNPHFQTISFV